MQVATEAELRAAERGGAKRAPSNPSRRDSAAALETKLATKLPYEEQRGSARSPSSGEWTCPINIFARSTDWFRCGAAAGLWASATDQPCPPPLPPLRPCLQTQAALHDIETPAADIAHHRCSFETDRQIDLDRAAYTRMKEEEHDHGHRCASVTPTPLVRIDSHIPAHSQHSNNSTEGL